MVWPSSSGGGSSSSRFTVSVDSGKNGSVTVSPKRAEKGDTVTITVKPNEGYELDKLVVTGKNGGEVKLTNEGGGKYTFKMPASRVEIEASFAKIETEPKLPFADVSSGDWYYDAVVWATEAGVVNGMGDGTFAPNDNITRQEMATMLYRLAKAEKVEEDKLASFPDAASVADWAKDAMNWAVSTEIVNGSTHDDKVNYLDPTATALRCQAAAVACRYLALSK